jgi:hypothetical protein
MAEMAPINITIDQDALRKQLAEVIEEATSEFASRLRFAADNLDPSFWERQNEFRDAELERAHAAGFEQGKKETTNG